MYRVRQGFHCPWENNKWYHEGKICDLSTWKTKDIQAAVAGFLVEPVPVNKKRSTCILVIGCPRSGTSMTAGILQQLGVYMGKRFYKGDLGNLKGYFEDRDFADLHTSTVFKGGWPVYLFNINSTYIPTLSVENSWRQFIKERESKLQFWGVKDFPLIWFLHEFCSNLTESEAIVIHTHRNQDSIAKSLRDFPSRTGQGDARKFREQAMEIVKNFESLIESRLNTFRRRLLDVYYESALDNPEGTVDSIIDFVKISPSSEARTKAIHFIDPSLNRSKVNG